MKLFALILVACFAISFSADSVRAESAMVFTRDGAALSGHDPVAYFTVGHPVPGKQEYKLVWKRAEWWFATRENRDLFEANPRAYAPQYGGYCAYGVAKGQLTTTKPNVWMIHENRLYLVHSAPVMAIWSNDVQGHVGRADANWPDLLRK
ncbi:MAG: YHS domain-containing (seleno)protein [Paracoccaceae bacterium]